MEKTLRGFLTIIKQIHSSSNSVAIGACVPSKNRRALVQIFPARRVEQTSIEADSNSTERRLAPIVASPMSPPSPSMLNRVFSLANYRTLPLSSVTSTTTTIKSDLSATNSLPSLSTERCNFVERWLAISPLVCTSGSIELFVLS